ncbi:hemerythrin domain-containing protein [Mycolicibacterium rhodesiae]|uniref:Cation-binding protein n=1 Tax=Mycolicibacterium rhodesiae TaxID=36814 RepID=A0A1X0J2I6_MYCRH|nr:hemerythrin domain-containing protein [Mycolicibacterium rhodesiae]MCV7348059.1 hemerythrin domain-containing protein [Mycolicibacterium rhodesiae]ORB56097.1 cation-binding protein [Mycolicibacterium rhodesiae]
MSDIIDLIYADHDWLRRQFFRLDDATSHDELAAIWTTLSARLDAHADAEETVFYPALLKHGGDDDPGNPEGDPRDETEDAITDHNAIRDAVRESRRHKPGTTEWFEAVFAARKENGEHLDEEEREAMPDFIKSATLELRHELGMKWLQFYAERESIDGIDTRDKDADSYIEKHS